MNHVLRILSIVILFFAAVSTGSAADDKAPDNLNMVVTYCASGVMHFDEGESFCVEERQWPSIVNFRVIGDAVSDYRDFFESLAKHIRVLAGAEIREGNPPDLLVILVHRNGAERKTAKTYLDREPIDFDASALRLVDLLSQSAKGCIPAPYFTGRTMLGIKTAYLVDLSPFDRDQIKRCIHDQYANYFGISYPQKTVLGRFSWTVLTHGSPCTTVSYAEFLVYRYAHLPVFPIFKLSKEWTFPSKMASDILPPPCVDYFAYTPGTVF